MDLNLPFASAARQYRWSPLVDDLRELMHHLALRVGLPIDAVKKIRDEFFKWVYERQTLFRIQKRLTNDPWVGIRPYWIYKAWSGTHRMVNHNRVQWAGDLFMRQPAGGLPSWKELAQALTGP